MHGGYKMYTGIFETLPKAWVTVLKNLYEQGEINTTEYGTKSRFINGIMVEITNYKEEWHQKDPYCSKNRIKEYKKQFEYGYENDFAYTYMDRLTQYSVNYTPSTDQIEAMRLCLLRGKYESKRIQAITWIPDEDMYAEHPPCLQRLWIYPRLNNTVDVHIHYRSWDWFQAAESNIIVIMDMLNREVFEPARFKVNTVRLFGDNVHYYLENEDEVEQVLKTGY